MLLYAFARRGRRWLVLAFVSLFVVYTTIGFRFRVVILVLAPAVYYYLKLRTRPGIFRIATGALAFALLIGGIGLLRSSFRAGERVDVQRVSLEATQANFVNDLDIYQPYLAMIDVFPKEHDYLWGSSYAYLLVHPVPRSLWPGKPEAPVRTIVRLILGPEAETAGVAYPNVGELYANFGVVGLVGGMWLFGILLRVMYEYLRRHESNDWARIGYAIALPFLVQIISRGYFVQIFQEAFFIFSPLGFGMWLCGRMARRKRAALVHNADHGQTVVTY
jgi:oligosaccharide repeat unit polymerase